MAAVSDLVKRDEVEKVIADVFEKYKVAYGTVLGGFGKSMKDKVKEIPIAYDVEKVLQKLREVTKYNVDCYEGKLVENGDYDDSWNDDIISANEAFEIVEKGGVE